MVYAIDGEGMYVALFTLLSHASFELTAHSILAALFEPSDMPQGMLRTQLGRVDRAYHQTL